MTKYRFILGSLLVLMLGACDDNGDEGAGNDSSDNGGEATDSGSGDAGGGGSLDTASGTFDVTVTGSEAGSGDFCNVIVDYANNTGLAFDNVAFNLNYHDGDRLVGGAGCGQAALSAGATGSATCQGSSTCDALAGVTYSLAAGTAQCNTEGEDTGFEPCDALIAVTSDSGG